jgi:hypothetical protein
MAEFNQSKLKIFLRINYRKNISVERFAKKNKSNKKNITRSKIKLSY